MKRFNDQYYEITVHKTDHSKKKANGFKAHNDEKLDCNLSRARTKVFELAMCNEFTHFFTGTLSKEKVVDRYNLDTSYKPISQFYRNIARRDYGTKIDYLVMPETHKDGAWHFHGLMAGIPDKALMKFPEHAPKYLRDNGYLNWKPYADRFGWCSLAPIKDTLSVSKYITKYVTKTMEDTTIKERVTKHLYYHSKGLKMAQTIQKGTILGGIIPDCHLQYENDYIIKYSVTDKEIGKLLFQL